MAGHSKWKNIQHRKGVQDAKRGQVFTRCIREITIAAKASGDPASNSRLRAAIDKALSHNMSKDTIQKAIAKGSGQDGGADLIEVVYEGYAPGGVAFLVECATDNRNRTVSEIRHLFTKAGGSLSAPGSVSYLFEERGIAEIEALSKRDEILDLILGESFIDLEEGEESIFVEFPVQGFSEVCERLRSAGLKILSHEVTKIASNKVPVSAEDQIKIQSFYDKLDSHDDVQALYCNVQWSDEIE